VLTSSDAAAIADAFGLGEGAVLSGPVARGELGRVWRLTTSIGTWAVKEPVSADWAPPATGEEVAFQEAALAAGAHLPRPRRTSTGRVTARVGEVDLRVHEWVELLGPDPDVDAAAVGTEVGAIHRCGFMGTNPLDWWYTEPVGAARWDELVVELRAAGAPFAGDLAARRDDLVALEALVEPGTTLQTCHRDLWADNVLATAGGGLCVIDWDNCGLADPSHELAAVLYEFAFADPARVRALVDAYSSAGGTGRLTRRSDFTMAIAQIGHIGERACARWLDPSLSEEEHARAIDRAVEFLTDRPLTITAIDDLLDAAHSR
jgi:Ser/Thr protein kinase RdoA (MazF antagonist)